MRMLRRRLMFSGFKRYPGDAERICEVIVDSCWNGEYVQVSNGHFCQFYSRDFGWCTDSLLRLGHKERAKKTISYALGKFKDAGQIMVAITPRGKPFNFPNVYSIDSVAYFMRSVARIDKELFTRENEFFQDQIDTLFKKAIDEKTGLVKAGRHFSSMKDHAIRSSSCYDNTMIAMLSDILEGIKSLENPFKELNMKKRIKDTLWTGRYFLNDISGDRAVTGDSNIYPFWFNLFPDSMMKNAIRSMEEAGLTKPFPLKYAHGIKKHRMIAPEFFVKDWEHDTIWPQMGLAYIDLLSRVYKRKAKNALEEYTKRIYENGTFIELYDRKGKPYMTRWYVCDEGLSWASMYLDLRRRLWQG